MTKPYIIVLFWLWPAALLAQLSTPTYSNEFLNLGVGGRSLGMGQAQTALATDATAGYTNPAGLTGLETPYALSLMHASYFAGIANYDYGAVAARVDSLSVIGMTALRFGVDDIPDTRFLYDANGALDYNRLQFFSAADYAFMFHYARQIPQVQGLSVGGSAKVVHRVAGNFARAWGFGLDLAARYERGPWVSALMLRDATGTFNAWVHNTELLIDIFTLTGNEIPTNTVEVTLPQLIVGQVYHFHVGEQVRLTPSVDFAITFDGYRNVLLPGRLASVDPRVGFEAAYREMVALRLGVNNVQRVQSPRGGLIYTWQPNLGLGVRYGKWGADYALTDLGDQSEALYSHIVSVQFAW